MRSINQPIIHNGRYGVDKHTQFGTTVKSASFDESRRVWVLDLADALTGESKRAEGNVFVSAVGQLVGAESL
jgi:cation diffusion facilitator CzcD-associated flavoprotein CzcO